MKKLLVPIIIVGLIVVLAGGYLARHKIKSLLGMNSTPVAQIPTNEETNPSTNPAAPSNNIYLSKSDPKKGNYMTDFAGMTLYTYDKDTSGVSNCEGGCLKAWPAYTSGAVDQGSFPANISVITRSDGSKQFAWMGKPLYHYATDVNPGDITGDGVGGVWHIIKL